MEPALVDSLDNPDGIALNSGGYVVYFVSLLQTNGINLYGYWSGKGYIVNGEHFPVTDVSITEKTKIYTSHNRARRSADIACSKFEYVGSYEIREIKVKESVIQINKE
jgi:hypothetical protein